jgi:hypothetical protein
MSQDITRRRVVYEMPNENSVIVRSELEFSGADGDPLSFDLYLPGAQAFPRPAAVVLVEGFPDAGVQKMVGCRFKDMQFTVSWATLLAASGLAGVAATNREPAGDFMALVEHLSSHAGALGIAEGAIGILATSGHAALGLSALMTGGPAVACGVFLYPFTMDLDEANGIAEMSKRFGFVNACAGRTLDDLRTDVPMFFARAGQDGFPHLNASLDRLVTHGLARNLPLTLVNYPAGVHAFDLMDPSERSKAIVKQALSFVRQHLLRD